MVERVVGYKPVERKVIVSRPVHWSGKGDANNGFVDLKSVTVIKTLLEPIYENLGPKVNTTMEDPIITIRETPLWGVNTDDATGKHKK